MRKSASQSSRTYYSYLEVQISVVPFTSHGKLHDFGAEKPIFWAKPAHFENFTKNHSVSSHILSTGGDALTLNTSCRPCLHLIQLPENLLLLIRLVWTVANKTKKHYRLHNTCQIGTCTDSNLGNSNIPIMFLCWVIRNHSFPKKAKTHKHLQNSCKHLDGAGRVN